MAEFVLNASDGCNGYNKLDIVARGYVEAMFFTNGDCGHDDENILNHLGTEALTAAAVKRIHDDVEAWKAKPVGNKGKTVLDAINVLASAGRYDFDQAGRDFWFDRQGHGVGIDDRNLPNGIANSIGSISRSFGECYVEVDDNEIHIS